MLTALKNAFRPHRVAILVLFFSATACLAQTAPSRPPITGISHVAYYVTDMTKSLAFWLGLLGFDLSYDRKKPDSTDTTVAFLKVNDHQYVELLADRPPQADAKNFMSHLCFLTDNLEQMRLYLAS